MSGTRLERSNEQIKIRFWHGAEDIAGEDERCGLLPVQAYALLFPISL